MQDPTCKGPELWVFSAGFFRESDIKICRAEPSDACSMRTTAHNFQSPQSRLGVLYAHYPGFRQIQQQLGTSIYHSGSFSYNKQDTAKDW